MKCSPLVQKNGPSCYDHETLHHIRNLWNKRHPDTPITKDEDVEIWNELRQHLQSVCSNEKCWYRREFSGDPHLKKILPYTFLPDAPQTWKKNPKQWLTSTDISKVMRQYERKYDNFRFIGPSPIDFDDTDEDGEGCVWDDLCHYNTAKHLQDGVDKVGVVFNLDPHYKKGSHWISLFIDYDRKFIFFFDSAGDKMPRRVDKFVKAVESQSKAQGLPLKEYVNDISHQWGKSECGIYCLYMITSMLEKGNTPQKFMGNRISDSFIASQRKHFFNLPE